MNYYSDLNHIMATTNAPSGTEQTLEYSVDLSLHRFGVPYKTFLSSIPYDSSRVTYHWVVVSAVVFDLQDRILLIQRSATGFFPGRWEVPGGGCEEEDKSIIDSMVRELREETGLKAVSVGPAIGEGYHFPVGSGRTACKYSFLVEVVSQAGESGKVEVQLDPNEHQNHVWATEEEVRAGRVGDIALKFTSSDQEKAILEAFGLRMKSKIADGTAVVAVEQ